MMNRKDFIAKSGQAVILAVMLGLVSVFIGRKQLTEDSECALNGSCRACKKLNKCSLPEAEKERENG